METIDRKSHWENIYETKQLDEVSWYQPNPHTSLHFFEDLNIPFSARIIDVGGGDSFLTDKLIDIGFEDVTLLDISEKAIARSKLRLGEEKASKVDYILSDIVDFDTDKRFDVWHDRAAFHFLTSEEEIKKYVALVNQLIKPKGYLIIGTFSDQGPEKCSGIDITQYSEDTLQHTFSPYFEKMNCMTLDHETPSGKIQNFIFCSFYKK